MCIFYMLCGQFCCLTLAFKASSLPGLLTYYDDRIAVLLKLMLKLKHIHGFKTDSLPASLVNVVLTAPKKYI